MKQVLLIIICFTGVFRAAAQDESYRGGIADGISRDSIISFPQSAAILMFAPYTGSIADGFASDSLITFAQSTPPLLFSPYLGSIADGYSSDSIINFTQYASILMFSPFLGSIADGYAGDSSITFPQHGYITMYQPFSGGIADGWTGYPVFNVTIVPLDLLSFTGEQKDKKHLLRWSTAQEQNAAYFDMERSADGRHFVKIGKVNAFGNSNTIRNYDLTDASPLNGNNYYRLKLVDADGSFEYSNIILLKMLSNKASIAIYPNPTTKTLTVLLGGINDNSIVNATIFDMGGRVLQEIVLKKSNASFNFDVERLPAGIYNLRIVWNGETSVWRFVKQ